ncbi:LysE/ArgO family amino acid transporter [Acinetobacter nectaris]|uniref:LysE/ArgO family amino acid transporter n=1 Tax=Acinetobacter nectaris TaxID=1219382 RepID=UPI001F1C9B36|nr:LysE/ArgO family amino acid transporter [Acinetobacter nectaris]MCF9033677.1 amino acid transporter [Acinetobacter nectaris]
MLWGIWGQGLVMGAGLIIAVGAQNAHVLRIGLQRQHVLLTVLICILCDAIAISLGVAGVGTFIQSNDILMNIARWGGALFLLSYGFLALKRALFAKEGLYVEQKNKTLSRMYAVQLVLAVSVLNPHLYLDTMVLLGAVGGQHSESNAKIAFTMGAISASILWFTLLGWGAQKVAPWLQKPIAWRFIDGFVAIMMFTIASVLIFKPI